MPRAECRVPKTNRPPPAVVLLAFGICHLAWSSAPPPSTLALCLLGHRIGEERTTIERRGDASVLTSRFEYLDRATKVTLDTTLAFAKDFTPLSFDSHGRSYRVFPVEATVPKASGAPDTFTLDGMAPLSAQGLLIRYWLAHGRPAAITLEPSGDRVRIEERGAPAPRGAAQPRLRHFSVDGVVWGREDIWLDAADLRVAIAFSTAGVMAFEAYDPAYEALAPDWRKRTSPGSMLAAAADQGDVRPMAAGTFALVGGRVIDATGGPALDDATVLVRNGRIEKVGARATITVPRDVRTVDVTGKTVLPGLWDMHAHVGQPEWGPVYLAAGVTTARDMGGEFDVVTALRDAWNRGPAPAPPIRRAPDAAPVSAHLLGPRLLLAGLVDGPGPGSFGHVTAANPDEGRTAVARYKAAGFQQMKLYSLLDRPTVAAVIAAAHASGMTVTGHIPSGLTMREVVEMGMDHIAHLTVRDPPGSDALRDTLAFLTSHGTVIDPTMSWNEMLGRSAQTPLASIQPGIAHVPPVLRRLLESANGGSVTPEQARDRLMRSLQIVKALHDAGVPIVAGTDKGVPGVSVPREIELYVQAGLSPMDAIRAATAVPARVMGLERDSGTIAPGLRADLIVVDGNPLERIADIRNVTMVAADGRLYEAAPLWSAGRFLR
jgi:imidazolonepropionase-like amidohydrolase